MKDYIQIVIAVLFAVSLRWCVTYQSHSGQDKPSMFGDYEAQRHWQEITFNLPIEEWYINSTNNDLQYWGLDYPPLTAYHSLLLGHVANKLNPAYVELHISRGISTVEHKYFMRLTVLVADIFLYIIPLVYYILHQKYSDNIHHKDITIFGSTKEHFFVVISALIYPGIILIDYGHFQYNCISLGFFIAAVGAIFKDCNVVASILFVLALNYKQMELYHALPFFFYLLGKYTPNGKKSVTYCLGKLIQIACTVIITFVIIWIPFLQSWELFSNLIYRLFPIARGVFEDKVANIWCSFNVIYNLRNALGNTQLAKLCLFATTIATLPSCINLYSKPSKENFLLSLINSALSFFLLSFQVHEKSILLVAIPVILYFHKDPLICFWLLIISHFSMLPLFIKDDLRIAYFATLFFYAISISWMWYDKIFVKYLSTSNTSSKSKFKNLSKYILIGFNVSMIGVITLSIVSVTMKPLLRYPDLFPLLISVYSCAHFCIFYLYFNYKQFLTSYKFAKKLKAY